MVELLSITREMICGHAAHLKADLAGLRSRENTKTFPCISGFHADWTTIRSNADFQFDSCSRMYSASDERKKHELTR